MWMHSFQMFFLCKLVLTLKLHVAVSSVTVLFFLLTHDNYSMRYVTLYSLFLLNFVIIFFFHFAPSVPFVSSEVVPRLFQKLSQKRYFKCKTSAWRYRTYSIYWKNKNEKLYCMLACILFLVCLLNCWLPLLTPGEVTVTQLLMSVTH